MSELLVEKQQGVPEGWKYLKIEEVLTIRHGQSQKEVENTNGPYPIFGTGGQMGWAKEYLYNKPSVLIGRKGTINKPRYRDQPFWTVDTLFYSEIKTGFNEKFVYYKFCMIDWSQYNEASGVPSLNASTIEAVSALFPSYKEQTAIATALSDVDELLVSLEALIAKKQAIKTATMQQLLSGRTRLPQFALRENGSPKGYKPSELGEIPEDWEVTELGDIARFLKGSGLSKRELSESGKYRCIHYGQLFTEYGARIKFIKSRTNSIGNIHSESNDILMPTSDVTPNGLATASAISESGVILGGDILIIRANKESLNGIFFSYLIPEKRTQIMGLVTGSTVYHIYGSDMAKFHFTKPPIEEQVAIATIFSDMDAEIEALEKQLNKTQQIKQGMMQQLLTGKIRLVKPN